ncbi:MAG: hypothetical protein AAF495_22085 [Pseudomonadota bacterium]
MVEYLVKAAPGFIKSKTYSVDLDGDHSEFLDMDIFVYASFGRYLGELVERAAREGRESRELVTAFAVIETISQSEDSHVLNVLTTGTYETVDSLEPDELFSRVVNRLGPSARKVWDRWMPLISSRKP